MWPRSFDQRLLGWYELRQQAEIQPDLESTLGMINTWWSASPWRPYYLHWHDQAHWPDPWQLLDDDVYCSLARGLGIMYTLALVQRSDIHDACLVETAGSNLVRVAGEKYILNWDKDTIVNIDLGDHPQGHSLTLSEVKQKIR